ncbi:hypothetical protein HPB50_019020 [Hyalomma asiaticum]|uniref:Uncharacterized protein n=1 Tax=Hyalomma asiaticum TaxID=266040 RepID=A0ACB7T327_HYAAI|nr:hypothetical protein HPB50_019020 [Hyalomma asiaticum]
MEHTLGLIEDSGAFLFGEHRAGGAGDERGAPVMELAATAGLAVINDPLSPPTYETAYAARWIDVTLATPAVGAAGCAWEVREDVTFSEHKYVTVRIGGREAAPRRRLTRYAQVELLRALSQESWFAEVVALESVMSAFYRVLNRYLDRYRRPVRPGRAGNSWWSPELADEGKRVNAMRRRYQRAGDESMRSLWRREYNAALARRASPTRGSVTRSAPGATRFRRRFGRRLGERLLPPIERPDGSLTSTHLGSAALLLRTQIAVDNAQEDTPENAAVRSLAEEPYMPCNEDVPFTEAEVRAIIAGMPSRSSPGPDEITPRLMRSMFEAHTPFVMHVLNEALRLGHFSRCWRRGWIIFLPKPDYPPQRTTSYRPLCVYSVFRKVLERLLNCRLYFLWKNGHVHANQFGFTHGRSAVSALVRLKERLAELKASRIPAVLMALDFQGAFDSVWYPGVLRFFRERSARELVPPSPQFLEGPLGGIYFQCRGDRGLGSRVLREVIGWSAAARVVVSREKTFCVLFTNGHRGMEKNRPPIRISSADRSLAYKAAIRVLGVVFDNRLPFFKHADHLREKAGITVSKIAALAQMQGGRLRPEQKTSLYRNVFLPGVTYASPVWWDKTRPDCRLLSRVVSIQRATLLGLLGAHRTPPHRSGHRSR